MRHFSVVTLLLMVFLTAGCDGVWYDDDDTADDWPESTATDAELTDLEGIYTCSFSAAGESSVVLMEECGGQFQGTGVFAFSVAMKDVDEHMVGGLAGLVDGAFLDPTFEDWYCPGYEITGDLGSCNLDGYYDFELTAYQDDFAGHDTWTDGATNNVHILHGYLTTSARPVVIEANLSTNVWTVYLRDDSGDDYHDLYFYGEPSDFDWPETLSCGKVSSDTSGDQADLDLCNYDLFNGDWEHIDN